MINYNMPYHIIEEEEGEFKPRLSFQSFDEAVEFIKFAPCKYIIVTSEELEKFYDNDSTE